MDAFVLSNLWLVWTFLVVLFLIIELTSGDLYMLCIAAGAAVTVPFAVADASITLQIIVFALATAFSILFLRPKLLRKLHRKDREKLSNVDAIIGRIGEVSESILPNGYGRVKLDGDDWKAQNITSESIEKGERVKIISRESLIITVEKV